MGSHGNPVTMTKNTWCLLLPSNFHCMLIILIFNLYLLSILCTIWFRLPCLLLVLHTEIFITRHQSVHPLSWFPGISLFWDLSVSSAALLMRSLPHLRPITLVSPLPDMILALHTDIFITRLQSPLIIMIYWDLIVLRNVSLLSSIADEVTAISQANLSSQIPYCTLVLSLHMTMMILPWMMWCSPVAMQCSPWFIWQWQGQIQREVVYVLSVFRCTTTVTDIFTITIRSHLENNSSCSWDFIALRLAVTSAARLMRSLPSSRSICLARSPFCDLAPTLCMKWPWLTVVYWL